MIVQEFFKQYRESAGINPTSFKGGDIYTPAHFRQKQIEPPDPPAPAFILGSALHCLILTPELFSQEYKVIDSDEIAGMEITQAGFPSKIKHKDWWKNFEAETESGKSVLMPAQYDLIRGMSEGLLNYIEYLNVIIDLKNGFAEYSLYAYAEFTEGGKFVALRNFSDVDFELIDEHKRHLFLKVKTRSDYFHKIKPYALDLKSCRCAAYDSFSYDIADYGYHIQGAFTLDMINTIMTTDTVWYPAKQRCEGKYYDFYFIAIENTPPHCAVPYNLDYGDIQHGREDYIHRLEWIQNGIRTGNYPGYDIFAEPEARQFQSISLPGTYLRKKNRNSDKKYW